MTVYAQYDTRTMLRAMEIAPPPTTFLQNLLVKSSERHDTEIIEVDVERAGQKTAAYVSRLGTGEAVGKDNYTTNIHLIPYTCQFTTFTAADLNERVPGETIYQGTPVSRANRRVGKALQKFRNRLVRTKELQLAQALMAGTQTIAGKDFVTYTVDYQRDATLTGAARTGTSRWGESAETIVADIRAGQKAMLVPGVDGGYADVMLLGVTAADNFHDSDEIKGLMDVRRLDNGQLNPVLVADQHAAYIGNLKLPGVSLDVWSYAGQYVDSTGTDQYYFNENGMALINTEMRVETHYSMISNFKSGNFVGEEFPLYWISENGKNATVQLESGPLVATHSPNNCYYRQVGNG